MGERKKASRTVSLRLQYWLCAIPFFGMCIVLFIGFTNMYRYSGRRKYVFYYYIACCLPLLALFAAAAVAVWALQGAMENSAAFAAVAVGICCIACWVSAFLFVFIQKKFLGHLQAREDRIKESELL